MRAGVLNQRIIIEKMTETKDAFGSAFGWKYLDTVWASVSDISGREFIAAQGIQNEVSTRILIRYRHEVDEKARILHGNDVYNVLAVLKDGKKTMMTLMCKRGVSDG